MRGHSLGAALVRALAVIALLLALSPRAALAQSGPANASPQVGSASLSARWLDYQVDSSCPSAAQWAAGLGRRLTAQDRQAVAALGVAVEVRRGAAAKITQAFYAGRVRVGRDAEGEGRQVRGRTCGEVAEALSLIAAIAIEQRLATPRSAVAARTAPAPSVEPPSAPQRESLGSSGRDEPPQRLRVGASAFGFVMSGTAAGTRPGVGARVVLDWPSGIQPRLMAGVYFVREREQSLAGQDARARFALVSSTVSVCPWRLAFGQHVALHPCATLDVGRLSARGLGAVENRSHVTTWWASVGAEARLSLALPAGAELSVFGGGFAPLIRDEFYFEPRTTAFQAQRLGARAGVSLAVLF